MKLITTFLASALLIAPVALPIRPDALRIGAANFSTGIMGIFCTAADNWTGNPESVEKECYGVGQRTPAVIA